MQRNLTTLLLLWLVSGCSSFDNWLRGRDAPPEAEERAADAAESAGYLAELQQLVAGDPYTQVEIHADAESAATLTPNPSTELRYALVLATPGHAGFDPEAAARRFRELLARTEMLTSTELALATVYLRHVDEWLVLSAESRRLRSANVTAQSAEQRATAQRIASIELENEQLRRQLADVEQKLEAITSIERSIRAQDEDNASN